MTRLDIRKCLFGLRLLKSTLRVFKPKNRRLLRPSREITANTLITYNFQTVQFRPLFAMYNYKLQGIMANISESAKKFSPHCLLVEIFELVHRCPVLNIYHQFSVELSQKQTEIPNTGKYSCHAPKEYIEIIICT